MADQMIVPHRPRRSFDPQKSARYSIPGIPTLTPTQLIRYSMKHQYTRLFNLPFKGSHWRPRMNTIVIQAQGIAKPNSSTESSTAAFGVSFGLNCPRNSYALLHETLVQTQNRALLEAVRRALTTVTSMRVNGELDPRWKEVIIMVNSEYIAKGLSRWIWRWEQHDYVTPHGEPRRHTAVLQELQDMIVHLESDLNISVRFWKVSRDDVRQADQLAKSAMSVAH